MKRLFSALTLTVAAALTLAGCGSSNTTDSNSSSSGFNEADVTFAQSMIPHHEQAVEMAEMAQMDAATADVKQLADKVAAAQVPEIDTMTGWLKGWGKDVPSGSDDDMGGMDHDMDSMGSGAMPGMMSDQEMKGLDSATGAAFDRMWLTMMSEHHMGAIEMAKTEQANGKNAEAVALARKIEADQTAELAHMQDLLKS
jgi:uncharacterized protein (DUF305 family)